MRNHLIRVTMALIACLAINTTTCLAQSPSTCLGLDADRIRILDFESAEESCRNCHSQVITEYTAGPHGDSYRLTGRPACLDCHQSHLGVPTQLEDLGRTQVCAPCHEGADAGSTFVGTALSESMLAAQRSMELSTALLADAIRLTDLEIRESIQSRHQVTKDLYHRLRLQIHGWSLDQAKVAVKRFVTRVESEHRVATAGLEDESGFSETTVLSLLIGFGALILITTVIALGVLTKLTRRQRNSPDSGSLEVER